MPIVDQRRRLGLSACASTARPRSTRSGTPTLALFTSGRTAARLAPGQHDERLSPDERHGFLHRAIDEPRGRVAGSPEDACARGTPEEPCSPAGPAACAATNALRPVEERLDHERRRRNDHAAAMTAERIDEIDRHRSPDSHYAHRDPSEEMMRPDRRHEPIDP